MKNVGTFMDRTQVKWATFKYCCVNTIKYIQLVN